MLCMEVTQKVFDEICRRLAEAEDSLREICRDPEMPSMSRVMARIKDSPEWQDQYARARELQADANADEIVTVARSSSKDTFERDRLLVDALKWRASKMRPKVYGNQQKIELTGQMDLVQTIIAARKRSGV